MNPTEVAQTQLTQADQSGNALVLPSYYAIREQLQQTVVNDFIGPAGELDEELEERPRDRYLVGMLAPRSRRSNDESYPADEAGELAVASTTNTEDGKPDAGVAQKDNLSPSSFGLSFCVAGTATEIAVIVNWGSYERVLSETLLTPKGNPKRVWKRIQKTGTNKFPLAEGLLEP